MGAFNEVFGQITANGQILEINVDQDGAVGVQIAGTWTGTVQFEVTVDGQNWVAVKDQFNGGSATSANAVGVFQFKVAGFKGFRVRASAAITGTADVVLHTTEESA